MSMTYKKQKKRTGGTQINSKNWTRRLSPISKRAMKTLSPLNELKYAKPFKIPLPKFKTGDVINLPRSKTTASELQITGAVINPSSGKYEYTAINLNNPDKILNRNVEKIDKLYVKHMLAIQTHHSASKRLRDSIGMSRARSERRREKIIT